MPKLMNTTDKGYSWIALIGSETHYRLYYSNLVSGTTTVIGHDVKLEFDYYKGLPNLDDYNLYICNGVLVKELKDLKNKR